MRGLAAAEIARDGFARDPQAVRAMVGQRIEVRGFVDHGELYRDSGARAILAEYWSGEGTTPGTWRFDLKSADALARLPPSDRADGPQPKANRAAISSSRTPKARLSTATGRLCARRAPSGAVGILATSIRSTAGQ